MADNETKTVTLIAPNGQQVSVAESKKVARLGAGYQLPGKANTTKTSPDVPPSKYDGLKLDELKDAIDERNDDGRADDVKLSKAGNKADLVKVLVADDEAQAQND